jgi:hypothetical protein
LEAALRRAALYDWHGTRDYLAWLIDERPYQAALARNVLTETIAADLLARKNILDIAGAQERLHSLLPDPKILQDYVLESAFRQLEKAAELASDYCRKFGVVHNSVELEYIISSLDAETGALYAKKRSRAHRAIYDVIKVWQRAVHGENARSKTHVWQTN